MMRSLSYLTFGWSQLVCVVELVGPAPVKVTDKLRSLHFRTARVSAGRGYMRLLELTGDGTVRSVSG